MRMIHAPIRHGHQAGDRADEAPLSTQEMPVWSEKPANHSLKVPSLISIQVVEAQFLSATEVVYTVCSKTDLIIYPQASMRVQRRIQDFQWLHDQLERKHASSLIPPLPPSSAPHPTHVTGRYRFLEHKRRSLERFLQRIASHHLLYRSKWLQLFLQTTAPSLFQSIQAQSLLDISPAEQFPGNIIVGEEPDPWFASKIRYFSALHASLQQLAHCAQQVTQYHHKAPSVHSPFVTSLRSMSSLEDDSECLSKSLNHMSQVMEQLGECRNELSRNSVFYFVDILSEHAQLSKSALRLLHRRSIRRTIAEAAHAKHEHEEALGIMSPEGEGPNSWKAFESFSQQIREEIEDFEATKTDEIQTAITEFVQLHMRQVLLMKDQWHQLLLTVKDRKD